MRVSRPLFPLFGLFLISTSLLSAPVHEAAKDGNAEVVYDWIERYPTMLELRDEQGASPLYYAARHGHKDLVQGLIDRGAEATVATTDGLTPLHWAALEGYLEVCRILLDHGADVNARSLVQGNTPLHEVWNGEHWQVAELLIERGAEVNAVEKWYGMTILHYAAVKGQATLAATLIAHGADISIEDRYGRTAAQSAATPAVAGVFRMVEAGSK